MTTICVQSINPTSLKDKNKTVTEYPTSYNSLSNTLFFVSTFLKSILYQFILKIYHSASSSVSGGLGVPFGLLNHSIYLNLRRTS